jgi:RNA polymerase sigma-70 factor (ECF subfamily)
LAEGLLGSRQDGEECVNDTWLNAWNDIPPRRPTYLGAYLARLCRNAALNRIDWQTARKRDGQVVALTAELETCIPDDLRRRETADREELGALLTAFLNTLPEEQRLMFLRRYWYGDPIRDIAKRYGCGESKVKTVLLRTRKRLRDYLEQEGITV